MIYKLTTTLLTGIFFFLFISSGFAQVKKIKKAIAKTGENAHYYDINFSPYVASIPKVDHWMRENGYKVYAANTKPYKNGEKAFSAITFVRTDQESSVEENPIDAFIQKYEQMKPKDQQLVDELVQTFFCNYGSHKAGRGNISYFTATDRINHLMKKYDIRSNFIFDHLQYQNIAKNISKSSNEGEIMEQYHLSKYDLIKYYKKYPAYTFSDNKTINLVQNYMLLNSMSEFEKKGSFKTILDGFDYKKLKDDFQKIKVSAKACNCSKSYMDWVNARERKYESRMKSLLKSHFKSAKQAVYKLKLQNLDVSALSKDQIKKEIDKRIKIPEVEEYLNFMAYRNDNSPFKANEVELDNHDLYYKRDNDPRPSNKPDFNDFKKIKKKDLGYHVTLFSSINIFSPPSDCTFDYKKGPVKRVNKLTTYHHHYYYFDCENAATNFLFALEYVEANTNWNFSLEDKDPNTIKYCIEMIEVVENKSIFEALTGNSKSSRENTEGYTIIAEEGTHSIKKDEANSFYAISIYDGGLLSSNLDKNSYSVTYKSGGSSKTTHDPFNDSLSEVASSLSGASELEVIIEYRPYKGGPLKKLHVKFEDVGWYTINII